MIIGKILFVPIVVMVFWILKISVSLREKDQIKPDAELLGFSIRISQFTSNKISKEIPVLENKINKNLVCKEDKIFCEKIDDNLFWKALQKIPLCFRALNYFLIIEALRFIFINVY